jgi:hypothetical protein
MDGLGENMAFPSQHRLGEQLAPQGFNRNNSITLPLQNSVLVETPSTEIPAQVRFQPLCRFII